MVYYTVLLLFIAIMIINDKLLIALSLSLFPSLWQTDIDTPCLSTLTDLVPQLQCRYNTHT